MNEGKAPGLYVHVPFCLTKCPYCDFSSVTELSLIPEWIEGIKKECLLYKDQFPAFDSLYLGGGTPSLLPDSCLAELTECLFRNFRFLPGMEFTLEANPDDLNRDKISFFISLGVNRISLGAQSFDEGELRVLGRRHTAGQTIEAVTWARECGLDHIGLDLMYALPGQTLHAWQDSLKVAVSLKPEHLSCYQLTLGKETPMGRNLMGNELPRRKQRGIECHSVLDTESSPFLWIPASAGMTTNAASRGESPPARIDERTERAFFLLTSRFLEENGYIHYEVSNFAQGETHISRHNTKYWQHVPYLGLGPSAHSFQDKIRWWNSRSVRAYCTALANGRSPVQGSEILDEEQFLLESLFLGLRTTHGVDLSLLDPGPRTQKALRQLRESGLVHQDAGRITPTKEGYLMADSLPLLLSN